MQRMCCFVLAWTCLTASLQADDTAKKRIDEAIAAVGGETSLAKLKTAAWKGKGTYFGLGPPLAYNGEWMVQFPDRLRIAVSGEVNGQNYSRILVLNGDKGWVKLNNDVVDLSNEALVEEKHRLYVNWVATLAPLKDPAYQLDMLPDSRRIGDSKAYGVKVTHEGQREVKLYFDEKTHLLLACEAVVQDSGGKATQEVLYSEYRNMDGLKRPTKITVKIDGKRQAEGVFSDYQLPAQLEDGKFAKP